MKRASCIFCAAWFAFTDRPLTVGSGVQLSAANRDKEKRFLFLFDVCTLFHEKALLRVESIVARGTANRSFELLCDLVSSNINADKRSVVFESSANNLRNTGQTKTSAEVEDKPVRRRLPVGWKRGRPTS